MPVILHFRVPSMVMKSSVFVFTFLTIIALVCACIVCVCMYVNSTFVRGCTKCSLSAVVALMCFCLMLGGHYFADTNLLVILSWTILRDCSAFSATVLLMGATGLIGPIKNFAPIIPRGRPLKSVLNKMQVCVCGFFSNCEESCRRWHFQVSGADLNPFSSIIHIQILSSNCTFDTIVVLVVMFVIYATLKITDLNWTNHWCSCADLLDQRVLVWSLARTTEDKTQHCCRRKAEDKTLHCCRRKAPHTTTRACCCCRCQKTGRVRCCCRQGRLASSATILPWAENPEAWCFLDWYGQLPSVTSPDVMAVDRQAVGTRSNAT